MKLVLTSILEICMQLYWILFLKCIVGTGFVSSRNIFDKLDCFKLQHFLKHQIFFQPSQKVFMYYLSNFYTFYKVSLKHLDIVALFCDKSMRFKVYVQHGMSIILTRPKRVTHGNLITFVKVVSYTQTPSSNSINHYVGQLGLSQTSDKQFKNA